MLFEITMLLDLDSDANFINFYVEKTGSFIEIVNFNVRGRQYSVTGEILGLEALEEALEH